MTVTTVLFDNLRNSSHYRHHIEYDGSRSDFIAAIFDKLSLPKTANVQYLVEGKWISSSEFVALEEPIPKHVRCLVDEGEECDNNSIEVNMLPWRRFGSVTFDAATHTDLVVAGHRVRLGEKVTSSSDGPHGATGLTLWDGSLYLVSFLNANPELIRGKKIIELGAGQGLVGVCAGLLGASTVCMTDLDYALPGCMDTVKANTEFLHTMNPVPEILVKELDWFNPPSQLEFDVVLAADVVW
jgi:hypothetical protein